MALNQKMLKIVISLNIIQTIIYFFGFFNKVAAQTGHKPLVDVTSLWLNFSGIIFWSILSMLCVIGFTLTLYLLLSKAFVGNKNVGLIISAIGYGSPIIFSFFLIIPATLLILGTVFCKILILDSIKAHNIAEKKD
ncbi:MULTISPECIES: hypothetical protein [unclassified Enterococcus]|uniref:hypothetical protein n=1 Tax=unclassified Enterococcus TaxID=2608891 RepID=UPI001552D729|nr:MULTISPECIES: hypothetical protein [unclassified Enterococcus]MBS7576011.1 hypothetical protein [Enterococcus sp. MMGLQ5-2]MBS7583244.1 hypothetical protein [Enterococcus sp. MMGLQ5-1]NPD11104.1 hypothetical protein [Enterococcus sp. MMGLQ5-1]NPD35847.1 hypothetical protein [Enterococcus sp. MMGLQ5-2]